MYKNYIFDLYGTLVDIHTDEDKKEVWEKLCLFYGYYGARYVPEELQSCYKRMTDCDCNKSDSHEAYPEIRIQDVFRELFVAKGIHPDEMLVIHAGQFFRVLTTEYIRLYEGVVKTLEALKKKGKNIYLLSNAQRIFTEYELHMLDIEKYFDGILISSDYGMKKPDLRFFQILMNKYHMDPKECIMIGNDERTDIEGATKVGMDSYYIHSNISPEYSGRVNATYVQMEPDMKKIVQGVTKL